MKGERILKRLEIRPGMTIKDKYFHEVAGVTRFSLEFWERIKDRLQPIYKAEIKFDKNHWYRLYLTTIDQVQLILYGCSAGYEGQGSRATAAILKEAGFNPKRVDKAVFKLHNDSFKMYRRCR